MLTGQLDDLLALDLLPLAERLAARDPAVTELDGGQEWLAAVQLLTFRLTEEHATVPPGSWGLCSRAFAYSLEAAVASGGIDRQEAVVRHLNLSAVLLQSVPPDASIDLLNRDHFFSILFRELPMTADEARSLSENWRTLDLAQIRRLRAVKNLLAPAVLLSRWALGEWAEIYPSLP